MKRHLYDFRWASEDTLQWHFSSPTDTLITSNISLLEPLTITKLSHKHCAGSVRDGVYKPCQNDIPSTKDQCELCSSREGTFATTVFDGYNKGNISDEELEKLMYSTFVYLAMFDKDVYKVGVSREDRAILRQLEQGASYSMFIAHCPNGILARQIETQIRRNGVIDKLTTRSKTDKIVVDIDKNDAYKTLYGVYKTTVLPALEPHKELLSCVINTPQVEDFSVSYGFKNIKMDDIHSVSLDVDDMISGILVGAKGRFIAINTDNTTYLINTKELLGCMIDTDIKPFGVSLKSALQSSLL